MNVKALNLYLKVFQVRAIVIFTESWFQVSDIVIKCSFVRHGICAPTVIHLLYSQFNRESFIFHQALKSSSFDSHTIVYEKIFSFQKPGCPKSIPKLFNCINIVVHIET